MINRGKILALGSIRELTERIWNTVPVEIEFLTFPPEAVITSIGEIDGVIVDSIRKNTLTLRVTDKYRIPSVIQAAMRHRGEIFRVSPRDYSLEEIYFTVQEPEGKRL
jgi:hypothetical protein